MTKVNVQIEVPERLHGTELEQKLLEKVSRKALEQAVLDLYRERAISTGTGAELLGMPLYDFMLFLGQHELSIFPSTEAEVAEEMANAERELQRLRSQREQQ